MRDFCALFAQSLRTVGAGFPRTFCGIFPHISAAIIRTFCGFPPRLVSGLRCGFLPHFLRHPASCPLKSFSDRPPTASPPRAATCYAGADPGGNSGVGNPLGNRGATFAKGGGRFGDAAFAYRRSAKRDDDNAGGGKPAMRALRRLRLAPLLTSTSSHRVPPVICDFPIPGSIRFRLRFLPVRPVLA